MENTLPIGVEQARSTKEFPDILVEDAYQHYMATLTDARMERGDSTPESMAAAIAFLGSICDYYLNKMDGDFIKIEPSQQWQR